LAVRTLQLAMVTLGREGDRDSREKCDPHRGVWKARRTCGGLAHRLCPHNPNVGHGEETEAGLGGG
jgi:hypothetical protein